MNKEATRPYLDAVKHVTELVRRQRWCRSCETLHYVSPLTPVLCPICESEDVEVR